MPKITDFTEDSAREIVAQGREILTAEMNERYKALALFTDGKPWSEDRYITELIKDKDTLTITLLDMGKRLVVMHEMMNREKFLSALTKLDFSQESAYRYMRIAVGFAGFDQDLVNELGRTKLYSLLKAPEGELKRLQGEGKFFDMDTEQLVSISTRELESKIKDSLEKVTDDWKDERAKNEVLRTEIKNKNRELDKTQKQLSAKERGEEGLPTWWTQYAAAIIAMETLVEALKKDPPDTTDKKVVRSFEIPVLRIERAVAGIMNKLRWSPHDEEERVIATQKKLAEISTEDGEFNLDRIINPPLKD